MRLIAMYDFCDAGYVASICSKYSCDIDGIYNHYVVDAKSVLGMSFIACQEIEIKPITDDRSIITKLQHELQDVGISARIEG